MTYVIANTQTQGKSWAKAYLPKEEKYKIFSTSNQICGKALMREDCVYIITNSAELLQVLTPALCGCRVTSCNEWIIGKSDASKEKFGPFDEADKCTCSFNPCVCWHDEK